MKSRRLILSLFGILTKQRLGIMVVALQIATLSSAQEITMMETLDYINSKLAPCCSIDVNKGTIIAVYKEGGQQVREDVVNISDLNIQSIRYDEQEHMLSINCKGAPAKKCVTREIPNYGSSGVYRPYARISWEVHVSSKSSEGLKKAFAHMINLVMDSKYKSSEPFE